MTSSPLVRAMLSAIAAATLILLPGCAADRQANVGATATPPGAGSGAIGDAVGQPAPTPTAQPEAAPEQTAEQDEPATGFPTTARAYAEAAVAAWSTGDLNRLAELTTPGVHEQFLEIPGQLKTDWIHYRCDGVAGSTYCTLRNGDGDSVRLRVTTQYLGQPHAVVELAASLTVYPATGEPYVSEFVRAWVDRNTPRMRALARPDVVVAVNDNHQDRPQGTWTLSTTAEHGGAGLLIVDVVINEGEVRFTLHVGTTLLGGPKAIVGYEA